jgi:hypothetical protein
MERFSGTLISLIFGDGHDRLSESPGFSWVGRRGFKTKSG